MFAAGGPFARRAAGENDDEDDDEAGGSSTKKKKKTEPEPKRPRPHQRAPVSARFVTCLSATWR